MEILVTGAAGFIGKSLTKALQEKGHNVVGSDIVSTNEDMDIKSRKAIQRVFTKYSVDNKWTLIHLAAKVGGSASQFNFYKYWKNNVYGTANLIEEMIAKNVKKIIFISSASIYGDTKNARINEQTCPNPNSPYAFSKLQAEEIINFNRKRGIQAVILRPTFIYGPNQQEKNIIQQLLLSAKTGDDFLLYGKGIHTRAPLFIKDVIDLLGIILSRPDSEGTYCIANRKETTINEMITITQSFGKQFKVIPIESDYAFSQSFDISKVVSTFGWEPTIDIREGIEKCIKQ
jgi:UDP-glucose 4-epimerase